MRAHLPSYEIQSARNLKEALKIISPIVRPFAGGTDLMVLFESGKLQHKKFLNLWNLDELRGIRQTKDAIEMGALTTYSEIQANKTLQKEFPILCQSSFETGAVAIQNRGTLGGNIANASPAADSSPGLLVYEAEIELISRSGSRWIPYGKFHLGYKKTEMKPDELIKTIRLPRSKIKEHYFRKVGTRKAQAISKICFAGIVRDKNIKIALGSVGPTAIRCLKTEAAIQKEKNLQGKIKAGQAALRSEISPIDDIRSNSDYRLRVSLNLLEDFLKSI